MHKKRNKIIASVLVFSLTLSNLNIATCKTAVPESNKTIHNNQSVNRKVAFVGISAAGISASVLTEGFGRASNFVNAKVTNIKSRFDSSHNPHKQNLY